MDNYKFFPERNPFLMKPELLKEAHKELKIHLNDESKNALKQYRTLYPEQFYQF